MAGYTPPVIRKGDDEYAVIVSGVKDTGLSGKYWSSDGVELPRRRRACTMNERKPEVVQSPGKYSIIWGVSLQDNPLTEEEEKDI